MELQKASDDKSNPPQSRKMLSTIPSKSSKHFWKKILIYKNYITKRISVQSVN